MTCQSHSPNSCQRLKVICQTKVPSKSLATKLPKSRQSHSPKSHHQSPVPKYTRQSTSNTVNTQQEGNSITNNIADNSNPHKTHTWTSQQSKRKTATYAADKVEANIAKRKHWYPRAISSSRVNELHFSLSGNRSKIGTRHDNNDS